MGWIPLLCAATKERSHPGAIKRNRHIAMDILQSKLTAGPTFPNIAAMLQNNAARFGDRVVFRQKSADGEYHPTRWSDFFSDICNITRSLEECGFGAGHRMVIFSRNRLEMLELELAVMAMGGVAIPIFAHFKKPTSDLLIGFSDAGWIAAESTDQLAQISLDQFSGKLILIDLPADRTQIPQGTFSFQDLRHRGGKTAEAVFVDADPGQVCLGMYTSGTMDVPKLVQLTHRNILSQQAAIAPLLKVGPDDRFLSYLPWHHSFGGIFELFSAICNGAAYAVESSYGKDVSVLFENWKQIRPTVFFSVPKVYQSLFEMTRQSAGAEDIFFNSGLRFVFTAAAALPVWLSDEFERRKIPVIEGWGLTETSPCCTLTDPALARAPGVVGMPIPGVFIRIDEEGEILIKGPNVMAGYYKNDAANERVFTSDGWFKTGDVGELTDAGLKLISRKDRIFKLSNGEKVIPTDLETAIQKQCHYVQYILVTGSGADHPVALIFPNKNLLEKPDYLRTLDEGCFCPRNLNELGRCLTGCLKTANDTIHQKFSKLKSAAVILDELSIDNATLTPSMKMAPNNVLAKYRDHLRKLYGDDVPTDQEVYVIEL